MTTSTVRPSASAKSRLRPIGAPQVDITGGFWADRLRVNREHTIPHGYDQLGRSGALGNLLDRIRSPRGVVDFIDVGIGDLRFWTFNLADVGITCGAVLLVLAFQRAGDREAAAAPVQQAVTGPDASTSKSLPRTLNSRN